MIKETVLIYPEKSDWIILPGARTALLRHPQHSTLNLVENPKSIENFYDKNVQYRLATHAEVISITGSPYPWGYMPENKKPTKLWQEKRIGFGGLVHDAWFILENGERIGGAPNVPETGPGAERCYLLTTGGSDTSHQLNENEGYALVWKNLPKCNEKIYRMIHHHVSQHVTADRGGVIISPVLKIDEVIYVGFTGRCMSCPNPEKISIKALQHACPSLNIQLHPDWKNWEC